MNAMSSQHPRLRVKMVPPTHRQLCISNRLYSSFPSYDTDDYQLERTQAPFSFCVVERVSKAFTGVVSFVKHFVFSDG